MMNLKFLATSKVTPRALALCGVSAVIFTSGCANIGNTAGDSGSFAQGAVVTGKIHGGNQPVGFATVQIYTVGQSGVGSSGTLLATTMSDAGGNFSFNKQSSGSYPNTGNTYACPATGPSLPANSLIYIISHGGNTTGTGGSGINNSAAVFLAPLGYCNLTTNSQYVNISEVTTAAMVASTAQFINPSTEMIGNDGIGVAYQAINNSFNMVPNLVNLNTGLANTTVTTPAAGNGLNVTGASTTVTPEFAKLNTVANILSACINQVSSTGANCSTLFASAAPPPVASRTSQPGSTFPAAADTLQAALYMFLNPTDSSTSNRNALFNLSPAIGAPYQPTATTLPTDWTISVNYSSTSTCGTGNFLGSPYDVEIDLSGNAWIANGGGSLVGLTPAGAPYNCANLGGSGHGTTIDIAGNVWYLDSTNNFVYRYTPSSGAVRTYNALGKPYAIATNDAGDVFYTTSNGTTGNVFRITNGANSTGVNTPTLVSNTVGPNPASIFPDTAGGQWISSGSSFVTNIMPATGGPVFLNGYNSTPYNIQSPTYGVSVGPANRIFITSQNPAATLSVLIPVSSSYGPAPGFPTSSNAGGMSNPTSVALDGGLNSWIGNSALETTAAQYALSIIALDGTAISASGNTNGGYQKPLTSFNSIRRATVDSGGNVWVVNDNLNSVTELVGSAVPVVQPYSYALSVGRFQTIP